MADIVEPDGTVKTGNVTIQGSGGSYSGTRSYQDVGVDLTLGAAAGKTGDTAFLAPIMGNLFGAVLSKLGNYLGGLIGHYSVTGAGSSTFPTGAVLAGIGDGSTDADGAVVAYIDGDSAVTNCGAMFKVRTNNSSAGSGPNFGLDLQDAAHDGFQPVNAAFYKSAPLRLVADVVFLVGAAAPTDGVAGTGANVAGPGSLYSATTAGKLYINTNTKASPTWTIVGTQA